MYFCSATKFGVESLGNVQLKTYYRMRHLKRIWNQELLFEDDNTTLMLQGKDLLGK